MKRTRHKILSVFLSVCMIFSCMAGMSVTASADPVTENTYTITIPSALTVSGSGWNSIGNISASGTLADGKKLTVSAASDGEFALVNTTDSTKKVTYTINNANGDAAGDAATSWEFTTLPATQAIGIDVTDYSSMPAGTYTDTVTFTASVVDARQLYSITLTGPYSKATLVMEFYEGDTWNDMAAKYPTYIKIYSGKAAFYTDGFIYPESGSFIPATDQINPEETYKVE